MAYYDPKKKMLVSKLVTRLPHVGWRGQSNKILFGHELNRFARSSKDYFIALLITVIGMATALTWNDFIRGVIDVFFTDRHALYAKFYVAVLATIFTLFVTYMISRMKGDGRK